MNRHRTQGARRPDKSGTTGGAGKSRKSRKSSKSSKKLRQPSEPSPSSVAAIPSRSRRGRWIVVGAALAAISLAAIWHLNRPNRPNRPTVAAAQSAFDQGDFAEAIRLGAEVLRADPDSKEAMLVAGIAALAADRHREALRFLRGVAEGDGEDALDAIRHCCQLAVRLGRLSEAEFFFRSVLKRLPEDLAANQGLLNLLRIEGRNWEAQPAVYQALRQGQYRFEYLALAGPLESVWINEGQDAAYLNYCARAEPQDLLCLLGPSRTLIMEDGDLDKARKSLARIVAWNPDLIEAQAALGQLLFNSGAEQDFMAWHGTLPKSADRHPSIWITRARWARSHGQTRAAIRCLWEAMRIFPNDRAANLLLANLLAEVGDGELSAAFQRRGETLQVFDNLLMWGELQEVKPAERLTKMIEALEKLGRLWEAKGWCHLLLSQDPNSSFAAAALARLEPRLGAETPLTLASMNPTNAVDYSKFPLPDLITSPGTPGTPGTPGISPGTSAVVESASAVSFEDVAPQAELDFAYFLDTERFQKTVYTFDFAGGGVAAWDYDQDGWPDLYLTQSSLWPPAPANRQLENRLFRNQQGESFADCTRLAGVGDTGFGNGVAVGDVDGDGFSDLYVNNLGPNRLYLNNGDGTFSDGTERSGVAGDDYSLSAVFVDLNLDGLPELYVVNYLAGDAMTRQCHRDGKPIQCNPLKFPGQQDRLYLNLGDGRFRDVTEEAGILDPLGIGKGMDVVAADLDGAGGPDLFVANDTTANFLFVNKTPRGSQDVRLQERGTLAGVAFDDLGRVQSSMGIAAQDANQDGLIDLFVTNFHRERNSLYVQTMRQPSLLFNDDSLASNLSQASFHTMGWGTQFIDAELDGDWDLAVANGYLGENTSGPESGLMRAQFFENLGAGRFVEPPASQLGPYFEAGHYGRALARLDWNRDGREDLCVTQMDAPVSLLQNTSQRRGRFMAVQLRGVQSSRDAIGATIRISAGGKQWTAYWTAGGGFEAASQQQLLIGLGDCREVERLAVRWPDGSEQTFEHAPVERELLLIQGRATPILLPSPSVRPSAN